MASRVHGNHVVTPYYHARARWRRGLPACVVAVVGREGLSRMGYSSLSLEDLPLLLTHPSPPTTTTTEVQKPRPVGAPVW